MNTSIVTQNKARYSLQERLKYERKILTKCLASMLMEILFNPC